MPCQPRSTGVPAASHVPDARPDPELVRAVAAGDARALEALFHRHAAAVAGVARRITGSQARAEDVLQEVFLRLWRSPERYDPTRGTLRSFLLVDANARAIEAVRSDTARRTREERDGRRRAAAPASVERVVWERSVAGHLADALDALPDGERQAIELAYYGGYTYREVAQRPGQPEGTVKSRIRAGLHRLHDRLVALDVRGGTWDD
jgi:RNA polymerase sigma-70 factor (ECF subfamily)